MSRRCSCFSGYFFAMLVGLSVATYSDAVSAGPPSSPLVLAVHPYLPQAEIAERFRPLAEYLSQVLNKHVEVRVGRSYDEHIELVGSNAVDFAFVGPAPYVAMVRRFGLKPMLARLEVEGTPSFHGYIVVRNESPIRTLADLKGKSFGFGDKNSTMGHIVPRYELHRTGISLSDFSRHVFLGAHFNVALAVLAGDFDAGAVKDEAYFKYRAQGLRALAKTEAIPEHVFVASSKMAPDLVEALRQALMALGTQPNGLKILRSINGRVTQLVSVKDSDFDGLRKIVDIVEQLEE